MVIDKVRVNGSLVKTNKLITKEGIFKGSEKLIALNDEDIWGIDDLSNTGVFNNILKDSSNFGESSKEYFYYVFAYGTENYLIGVTDNLFTAKIMELYQSFSNIGWQTYGVFYGSTVLKVNKGMNFDFNFDYIYKNLIKFGSTNEYFYKGLINDYKDLIYVETLSKHNFDDGFIPENPFGVLKDFYKEDINENIEWNLGGIFTKEELNFIKDRVYPLLVDKKSGYLILRER